MDIKLFKAATAFVNRAPHHVTLTAMWHAFAEHPTSDPTGGQWSASGFCQVCPDEYAVDVQGAALLAVVQINQRILPGAVIKEKIIERIAEIERMDGRKASKKDWAEVRDHVESVLLPKAFLRRKFVPVLLIGKDGKQYIFICTSSSKTADDVCMLISAALNSDTTYAPARVEACIAHDIDTTLTLIAKGEAVVEDEDSDKELMFFKSATLAGEGKQRITVKDKDIGSADVQALLKQDYTVKKLGLAYTDDPIGEPAATFVLNDSLTISNLVIDSVQKETSTDENDQVSAFFNNVWITARTLRDILPTIVRYMGGWRESAAGSQVALPKNENADSGLDDDAAQTQTDFEDSEL